MEKLLIATLIIASLAAVFGIASLLLILLKKDKNPANSNPIDVRNIENKQIENTADIKATINNLEKNISLKMEGQINSKMQGQITEIVKTMKEQSDADTKRLNVFQQSITENLNSQVKTMNDSVTNRLNGFQETINNAVALQVKTMNEKIDASMKTINEKVNQSLSDGFKGTSDSMNSLQKQLGIVQEAQKNINTLQNEITSLRDVLSNNQQRGKYGEFQLELLLENLFQGCKGTLYDTQFILREAKGDEPQLKPDAVIFLDGEAHHQIVCVDSKFSITGYEDLFDPNKHLDDAEKAKAKSNFRVATRTRIEETSKYIIPGKTVSNSIMFVPNDGVFAYIHNEFPDLIDFAQNKKVVMVSPTILQPLLASFRMIQIDAKKSKNIAKINEQLNALGKEFDKFMPRWESLNKNIQALTKKSDEFSTTVGKIGKKFSNVQKIEFSSDEEEDGLSISDENEQIDVQSD